MAKQGQTGGQELQDNAPAGNKLEGLTVAAREAVNATAAGKGLPPVHLWNPPFCGDLDMRIASDGTWFYMGTPIGRPALVRLFSTILKREDGKHFLVTPVEKVGIRVDDAPFMAVEMQNEAGDNGRLLRFRTNVDDWVPCDKGHRLRFEMADDGGLTPYLHVRADLWAKVTRALYYDLVDMGEERVVDAFEVPLAFLMNAENHQIHNKEFRGIERSYYAMPYAERYIWGATAGILRVLYERIYLS